MAVSRPEASDRPGEDSATIRDRVTEAVARQEARYEGRAWSRNAEIPAGAMSVDMPMSPEVTDTLVEVADTAELTGRGLSAVRRVARTLADLEGAAQIGIEHVVYAAELRREVFE